MARSSWSEALECTVCLDFPKTYPVFQCNNGHLLCKDCRQRLKACPTCKIRLRHTRNLAVEQILESVPIECKFEQHGCKEKYAKAERLKHQKVCRFREVRCPYIACNRTFSIVQLDTHVPSHSFDAKSVNGIADISFDAKPENSIEHAQVSYWYPHQIKFEDRVFFVTLYQEHRCNLLHIWVWMIATPHEAAEFKSRIEIVNAEQDKLTFTCSVNSIDDDEAKVMDEGSALSLPLNVARRLWTMNPERLVFRVEVFRRAEPIGSGDAKPGNQNSRLSSPPPPVDQRRVNKNDQAFCSPPSIAKTFPRNSDPETEPGNKRIRVCLEQNSFPLP